MWNNINIVILNIVPPSIDVSPNATRISAKKGDNVLLECKAKGNPQPTVSWRRNVSQSF
jgi:hypothetical protein